MTSNLSKRCPALFFLRRFNIARSSVTLNNPRTFIVLIYSTTTAVATSKSFNPLPLRKKKGIIATTIAQITLAIVISTPLTFKKDDARKLKIRYAVETVAAITFDTTAPDTPNRSILIRSPMSIQTNRMAIYRIHNQNLPEAIAISAVKLEMNNGSSNQFNNMKLDESEAYFAPSIKGTTTCAALVKSNAAPPATIRRPRSEISTNL